MLYQRYLTLFMFLKYFIITSMCKNEKKKYFLFYNIYFYSLINLYQKVEIISIKY